MTKAEQKRLERIHILRTIISNDGGDGLTGVRIADLANAAYDDALSTAPRISKRGIGQKLNAMSLNGLVVGDYKPGWRNRPLSERVMYWAATRDGHKLAQEPADA